MESSGPRKKWKGGLSCAVPCQPRANAGRALLVVLACQVAFVLLVGVGVQGVKTWSRSGFVKFRVPAIAPGLESVSGYTPEEFWGIAIACLCLPLALVPALIGVGEAFSARAIPAFVRFFLLGLWSCTFAWCGVRAYYDWGGHDLVDCFVVGCAFETYSLIEEDVEDYFSGFFPVLGLVTVLTSFAFFVLACALTVATVVEFAFTLKELQSRSAVGSADVRSSNVDLTESLLSSSEDDGNDGSASSVAAQPCLPAGRSQALRRKKRTAKAIAMAAGLILPIFFVFLTTLVTSTWLVTTSTKVSRTAQMDVSTDSWKCRLAATTEAAAPLLPLQKHLCPEVPWAYFKTWTIALKNETWTTHHPHSLLPPTVHHHKVFAKVYVDVLLFYSFIYVLVLLGIVSSASSRARTLLHKRRTFKLGQSWYSTPSLVQIIVSLVLVLNLTLFTIHWYHDHNWHSWWPVTLPFIKEPSTAEKLARTSGQVASFLMGVLVLPASRTSIWTTLFDIPWETLLTTHIYVGYTFLFTVAFHMFSWWFVYSEQHIFPHDVLSTNLYFPLNFHAKPGECSTLTCLDPEYQKPAGDNWTIALASFFMLFIGFPVFGLLTLNWVRRNNFELFYYSHHAFLVLFMVVLWHASSSWFFVAIGIALWAVDRVLRFVSGMHRVDLISVDAQAGDANFTRIEFSSSLNSSLQAGHYVFLNVPAISPLQWHPFSISGLRTEPGRPSSTIASLSIKDCGDFTGQLQGLAKSGRVDEIRIDGPYGAPLMEHLEPFQTIVLVAGGIGCTPFFALLDEISAQPETFQDKRIVFLWSSRSIDLFHAFSSQLDRAKTFIPNLTVKLFLTSPPQATEISTPLAFPCCFKRIGDITEEVADLEPLFTKLMVCGPEKLVNQLYDKALEHDMAFRSETFLL